MKKIILTGILVMMIGLISMDLSASIKEKDSKNELPPAHIAVMMIVNDLEDKITDGINWIRFVINLLSEMIKEFFIRSTNETDLKTNKYFIENNKRK